GEPGRKLHTGRGRNDQVATDLAMWLQVSLRDLSESKIPLLQQAFVRLAERSSGVVMSSFTHLQRAQPICAAAEALAWAEMLQCDWERVAGFEEDAMRYLPLGSG